jgi:uncharacterized membrane protein
MIPKTVNGLPLHPLIIHATVVILPLAALTVLLAGLWPSARRRLSVLPLIFSAVAVILLPLSYKSGENLKRKVGSSPLIERHEHLAHQLLWPVLGLLVTAAIIEIVRHHSGTDSESSPPGVRRAVPARADVGSTGVTVAIGLLAVIFSVWTAAQTVRVGEAGAKAVWSHGDSDSSAPATTIRSHL